MSDTSERSVASDGSVAWGVVNGKGEVKSIHWKWRDAVGMALIDGEVVPLYRHSQPTLSDAEREAVKAAMLRFPDGPYTNCDGTAVPDRRAILRGLLERLSPPAT